jgi:hypothetical protein
LERCLQASGRPTDPAWDLFSSASR